MNYKENQANNKMPEQEVIEVLMALYQHDKWDERLLSDVLFGHTVESILQPRERFILEMKCEGKSDKYIRHVMNQNSPRGGLSLASYDRWKRMVKQKLKAGIKEKLPGWMQGRVWLKREEEAEDIAPDRLWEELP